ncbi:MAG: hypothetical protein IBJ11_01845 [Phycisphaerales bacterium]|nr:hypothetical protein [Phycisphaerales bacterium]
MPASEAEPHPQSPSSRAVGRCVLFARPGRDVPSGLLRLLESRGLSIVCVESAFAAMAELAGHERSLRTTSPRRGCMLLVIEPAGMPRLGELLNAAGRLAPHAVLWQYAADLSPALQPFPAFAARGERSAGAHLPAAQPNPRPASPALRLAGDARDLPESLLAEETQSPQIAQIPASAAEGPTSGRRSQAPVLSPEELAMLLGGR